MAARASPRRPRRRRRAPGRGRPPTARRASSGPGTRPQDLADLGLDRRLGAHQPGVARWPRRSRCGSARRRAGSPANVRPRPRRRRPRRAAPARSARRGALRGERGRLARDGAAPVGQLAQLRLARHRARRLQRVARVLGTKSRRRDRGASRRSRRRAGWRAPGAASSARPPGARRARPRSAAARPARARRSRSPRRCGGRSPRPRPRPGAARTRLVRAVTSIGLKLLLTRCYN